MKSRILNRNTILGILLALVVMVLFNSGVVAQGSATIRALFTGDSTGSAVAPAADQQPASPRP